MPLFGNWSAATRAGDTTTRDFAADLLNSVEPYGMLVTAGDNDTFPLWYAQEVEGVQRDVVILCTALLGTDWYPRQLVRAPIHDYDAARGPAIYRGKTWPRPSTPPVRMTLDEVDQIPSYVDVKETQRFDAGSIQTTITPRTLTKADIFVLRAIKDNVGRPIYFGSTVGGYGDTFGFGPYLLAQGLARKLLTQPVTTGVDTVLVDGRGFVDVPRSLALWTDAFQGPRSLVRKGDWPDRASVSIPVAYVLAGLTLSEILGSQGRAAAAAQILRDTESLVRATRTEQLFGGAYPPANDSLESHTDQDTSLPGRVAPAQSGRRPR